MNQYNRNRKPNPPIKQTTEYFKSITISPPAELTYQFKESYSANGFKCYVLKKVLGKNRSLPKYFFIENWISKNTNSNFRLCAFPFYPNSLSTHTYENENGNNRLQTGLYELTNKPNIFYGDVEGKQKTLLVKILTAQDGTPYEMKVMLFNKCYVRTWNDTKKAKWIKRNLKNWIERI